MADIFLSYASQDRPRAAEIAAALEAEGLSMWWDRALLAGGHYEPEIDAALGAAKAVVVLWSQAAAASIWVRSEAEAAHNAGRLIPVKIEACRVPRPYDQLTVADLTRWRGDRGNDGFPELVETAKALVEGRRARRIPWRRRLTLAGVAGFVIAALGLIASVTGIVDTVARWTAPGAFAARSADTLSAGDAASPETQEGFRAALESLAQSFNFRTQRALDAMEEGSREEALGALVSLAQDQSAAIDGQMTRTASLWRQIGLMRFNEDPRAAREALERARRYAPDDVDTLTALGALYQREGRIAQADEVYRAVMAQGALASSAEGRLRQVIGQALLERGDGAAAEREFARALVLAQESVDEMLEADLYIDLGMVEMDRGNFAGARQSFAQARDFALSFDYAASAAYADYNTAEAWIAENRFREAEPVLAAARAQAETLNERYLQLFIDLAAARIAARHGETQRALDIAEGVRGRAAAIGMRRAELAALMEIGEAELVLGQAEAAAQTARAALEGWRGLRAESAMDVAAALEYVAASHAPAMSGEACAALAVLSPAPGYTRREVARIARRAACAA